MTISGNGNDLRRRLERMLLPALVLTTLLVFSPVAWHDFINYDDDVYVYENPNLKAGLTLAAVVRAFTTVYEVNWIPLTWLSHLLDVQLFGMNPGAHHVVSLLLHTASSALLFLFLRRVTAAPWRSAAVAFLFALHPLHVESVAWIAERKDVLSTFFMMLTLNAYARYVAGWRRGWWYAAALVLFACGLMAKPMLVTLPVVLLLLDWWPLGRMSGAGEGRAAFRLLAEKIPFFLLSAVSGIVTYLVQEAEGELFQGYTLLARAGKACIAYVTYLQKMFWPADLAVLYPFSKYPPSAAKITVCVALLLILTLIAGWLGRRRQYLITGWFWYLVTLFPVIGLIQIGQHSMADRYTYIPLIGVFVILAWGVPQLMEKAPARRVILSGISLLVLAAMIAVTTLQLRHWKNGFTLFTHTVAVTRDNWVALNNLGLIYLKEGKTDEAIRLFRESLRAKPSYPLAWLNLGVAYQASTEFGAALTAFERVLQFDPGNPQAYFAMALTYLTLGDTKSAQELYQLLLRTGSTLAAELQERMAAAVPAERARQ